MRAYDTYMTHLLERLLAWLWTDGLRYADRWDLIVPTLVRMNLLLGPAERLSEH